ncbi:MAG: bifunctional riboflavin kinase/FAD synthetase [Crocinitomicaceae bacterium]|nr:bifunctional riboflavin kinase/FAD synthetase [Crocinitomicaceae bacterium]
MNIFEGLQASLTITHPVVTIGNFDGVHVGHQKIIHRLNQEAKKNGGESVLFTFHPHPRLVLNPGDTSLKLLQTQVEKTKKLKEFGLQNLIVYPFSKEFSQLNAQEFVRDILVEKIGVKTLVIGYDHHFGKNREGGLDFLRSVSEKYGFDVIEISAQEINDVNVSSTKIRLAIDAGEVDLVKDYLSDYFEINGTVIEGEQIGRELGFPTANLDLKNPNKLIPKNGVYAVDVTLATGEMINGMMNIGSRPTIDVERKLQLEVHLLDFQGDLYGTELTVRFHTFVREEIAFDSKEELIQQIKKDGETVRNYFFIHSK